MTDWHYEVSHTLLFLTQWEWQICQSFWLPFTLMEQRGQAAPAQIKLIPFLSDTLDLFLEGKIQVSSSIDSHDRWTEGSLKKNFTKNLYQDTEKSSYNGRGGRQRSATQNNKKISLLNLYQIICGYRMKKTQNGFYFPQLYKPGPHWSLEEQPPEIQGKPMQLT